MTIKEFWKREATKGEIAFMFSIMYMAMGTGMMFGSMVSGIRGYLLGNGMVFVGLIVAFWAVYTSKKEEAEE